jgi:hypothetical protein
MSVTVHIGVGDDESVRVPLLGDLPALLQGVRNALDVERDVDTLGQLQLRIQGGALLTEENFGDLTDGDSLELLIIQGSRMPPLQLLSSPVSRVKEEEGPPSKQSRLENDLSPDWVSSTASSVTLQSAADIQTPLSANLLQSPGMAITSGTYVHQAFTFPLALTSPLCTSEFGYVPLTPSNGTAFFLPSLMPVSPSVMSGPITTAQVVMPSNSNLNELHQNETDPVSSKQQNQNHDTDLHLPEGPVESLFPDQATLSEKLAYMKYLEEHPERRISFSDFVQECSQMNPRMVRPRSNSLHKTDAHVMSTLNARLRQKVAGALKRRKSEADIEHKVATSMAPPLVKPLDQTEMTEPKKRLPRRSTVAEMLGRNIKENETPNREQRSVSTPGPPPSLIPAHLVSHSGDSEAIPVPHSVSEVVIEMEMKEEKSPSKEVRRFPSNGTLSEKLAYLKWRESVNEEDDDLGYKKTSLSGIVVPKSQQNDSTQNSPSSAFAEP